MRWLVVLAALAGCDKIYGLGDRIEPDAPVPDAPPDMPIDAPTTYVAAVLADTPVAYYRMGEIDGVTCVDSVGTANGTYGGAFTLKSPGAVYDDPDTAVAFGGPSNAGATFGDVHEFDAKKPFTIELWANVATDAHWNNLVTKYVGPPTATGYVLYSGYNRLGFARGVTEATQTLIEYTAFDLQRWVYIVASYDGTTMRLYVDGVLAGEKDSAIVLPNQTVGFAIGSGNGSISTEPVEGMIDEVAIYDIELSAQRVYDHFAAGRTPPE